MQTTWRLKSSDNAGSHLLIIQRLSHSLSNATVAVCRRVSPHRGTETWREFNLAREWTALQKPPPSGPSCDLFFLQRGGGSSGNLTQLPSNLISASTYRSADWFRRLDASGLGDTASSSVDDPHSAAGSCRRCNVGDTDWFFFNLPSQRSHPVGLDYSPALLEPELEVGGRVASHPVSNATSPQYLYF